MVYHQPCIDASVIPTSAVCRAISSTGYRVALSGDGADELFFGYGHYRWMSRLRSPFYLLFFLLVARIPDDLLPRRISKLKKAFAWIEAREPLSLSIISMEHNMFSLEEIGNLLFYPYSSFALGVSPDFLENSMEEMFYYTFTSWLRSDMLAKVDRASMLHSLEIRVPYLDKEVIEVALRVPNTMKVKKGMLKYLLKKVLTKYLPPELVYRQKWGFRYPFSIDIVTLKKVLLDEEFNTHRLFNIKCVEYWLSRYARNPERYLNRVFGLALFNVWYRANYQ